MTRVEIRHGRVSARLQSPNPQISNMIRRLVPSSGREYDPIDGEWVISAVRVPALLTALRDAGIDVVEDGGTA